MHLGFICRKDMVFSHPQYHFLCPGHEFIPVEDAWQRVIRDYEVDMKTQGFLDYVNIK